MIQRGLGFQKGINRRLRGERMEMTSFAVDGESRGIPGSRSITTTLYALVEAVMEEVGPEEDTLVTRVVMGLLDKSGAH